MIPNKNWDLEFLKLWRKQLLFAFHVNAFYEDSTNSVIIQAPVLQKGIFYHGAPNYLNYGAIGSIIGHEIGHGLDNTRRFYNQDTTLKWKKDTNLKYVEKAGCFDSQYLAYKNFNYLFVGGMNGTDENIADDGGIRAAYSAYGMMIVEQPLIYFSTKLYYNSRAICST